MANGNGTNGNVNGGPWWVRFAERFGIPALFAIVLLYFLVGHVDAEIHLILEHTTDQQRYLRQICVNTSQTAAELSNCR